MSGKRNVSVCRGHELANALYTAEIPATNSHLTKRKSLDGPKAGQADYSSKLFIHAIHADEVKMVTRRTQNMNLRSSLTAAWDWSKKWDLPINPTKCNYLTIGREVPLRLSFFTDRSGTHISQGPRGSVG